MKRGLAVQITYKRSKTKENCGNCHYGISQKHCLRFTPRENVKSNHICNYHMDKV